MDDIDIEIEPEAESEAETHRKRARYLRQLAEATPPRPDRERLLVLAEQYEQLADRA